MSLLNMFGEKPPMLDRETAMNGQPVQLPHLGREVKDDKLHVTIEFHRPKWQQMLGAEEVCTRTFALDPYGREVYEACNGKACVNEIVRQFAQAHKLSLAEAEVAVSTFLKTLMGRGMIGMEMKTALTEPLSKNQKKRRKKRRG